MKKMILACICLLALQVSWAQGGKGRRIYLGKAPDNGNMVPGNYCGPGDTLVMKASQNPYSYVFLGGLKGEPGKPIVIINEGGTVQLQAGFQIEDCQYLKIAGEGSKDKYGFSVEGTRGVACVITKKCSDIEVTRLAVRNSEYGFWIKNEADCDSAINNWVLNNISVHDCLFRNLSSQAFYAGTTAANGERPIACNGVQVFPKPGRLGNIKIFNNDIDSTGRSGIQLSAASVGMSEIYNNRIRNSGRQMNDQQGNGIALGSYTRAYVHHNDIKNTLTNGISCFGSGLVRIENNTVDSSGFLHGATLAWPWNILVDTRETIPADSIRVIIKNNRVGVAGNKQQIYLGNTVKTWAVGSVICNNSVKGKPAKVHVDAGISWKDCKGKSQLSTASGTGNLFWPGIGVGAVCVSGIVYYLYVKRKKPVLSGTALAFRQS
jgi:hypothetical protein